MHAAGEIHGGAAQKFNLWWAVPFGLPPEHEEFMVSEGGRKSADFPEEKKTSEVSKGKKEKSSTRCARPW